MGGRKKGSKDSYKRYSGNYRGRAKGSKDLKPRATNENRGFDSWRSQNAEKLAQYRHDALKGRYLNEVLGYLDPTYRDKEGRSRCNFKVPTTILMQGLNPCFIEPYNPSHIRPIIRNQFRIYDFLKKEGIVSAWEHNKKTRLWVKRMEAEIAGLDRQLEKNKQEEKASQVEQCLSYCI